MDAPQTRRGVHLNTLVQLRWRAVVAQCVMVVTVNVLLQVAPVWWAIGVLFVFELVSNAALAWWASRDRVLPDGLFGVVVGLDMVLLTVLLWVTGGALNPFSFLYLVHLAMAAVTLPSWWSAGLVAVSLGAYGSLFVWGAGAHAHHHHGGGALRVHLQGMWVAFAVTAAFMVGIVRKVRDALEERERRLAQLEDARRRQERLASLATLAAGAAHELATPLSTIAVSAKELERELERARAVDDDLVADARLIRQEVARCRGILDHLAQDAGQSVGEAHELLGAEELVDEVLGELDAAQRGRIAVGVSDHARGAHVRAPRHALGAAIRGLVRNAMEAAEECDARVQLVADVEGPWLAMRVEDDAGGMSDAVLERAGEPFFTTKPEGVGMGLGLFLARSLAEDLGGALSIESEHGRGTTVRVALPMEEARI
ncbi:MAG: ATP-binding protein [Myxococcota bacterium]